MRVLSQHETLDGKKHHPETWQMTQLTTNSVWVFVVAASCMFVDWGSSAQVKYEQLYLPWSRRLDHSGHSYKRHGTNTFMIAAPLLPVELRLGSNAAVCELTTEYLRQFPEV